MAVQELAQEATKSLPPAAATGGLYFMGFSIDVWVQVLIGTYYAVLLGGVIYRFFKEKYNGRKRREAEPDS